MQELEWFLYRYIYMYVYLNLFTYLYVAESTGAIEYTDCISAEG